MSLSFYLEIREKLHLIFLELLMSEGVALLSRFYFMETVHVELADEWSEVTMFKMFGEYLGSQSVDVFDDETMTILTPTYNVFILGVLS